MANSTLSLGEALPKEMARVREVSQQYAEFRNTPGVNVEFAIAAMDASLSAAEKAMVEGDTVAMLSAYQSLQGFDV